MKYLNTHIVFDVNLKTKNASFCFQINHNIALNQINLLYLLHFKVWLLIFISYVSFIIFLI